MTSLLHLPVQAPVETEVVTDADVLRRAADLLEEFGWCQHAPARDEDGWSLTPCDSDARSFCLTGSVERAIFDLFGVNVRTDEFPVGLRIRNRPKVQRPLFDPAWNNAPERTREEVIARLRDAAEKASR